MSNVEVDWIPLGEAAAMLGADRMTGGLRIAREAGAGRIATKAEVLKIEGVVRDSDYPIPPDFWNLGSDRSRIDAAGDFYKGRNGRGLFELHGVSVDRISLVRVFRLTAKPEGETVEHDKPAVEGKPETRGAKRGKNWDYWTAALVALAADGQLDEPPLSQTIIRRKVADYVNARWPDAPDMPDANTVQPILKMVIDALRPE